MEQASLQSANASVDAFLQNIKKEEKEIQTLQQHIAEKKKCIRSYKQRLWTICSHEWVRDQFASFDDSCKYYCKKCDLWRDKFYYFN